MKLDHPLKFLPSPNRSRKHRAVLMLNDEEYSALESAARLHRKESIERPHHKLVYQKMT